MGNCVSFDTAARHEMKLGFDKQVNVIQLTAVHPEFKEKTTTDDTLNKLAHQSRAPQQSRTYKSGVVSVSVY